MTRNTKMTIGVLAVVIAAVAVLATLAGLKGTDTFTAQGEDHGPVPAEVLVRPDSHRLSAPTNSKVTVVEFLDLECEACRAAFPAVEQLRAEYGDQVTFVMRYFPLPAHLNAELAARSVEAAGRQGKLEAMYKRMYETQAQWGDQQVDHRDTFVSFARELGLDVPAFEAAIDDQAVIKRVRADLNDGITLDVSGTPTFFINGVRYEGRATYDRLKEAIDAELVK